MSQSKPPARRKDIIARAAMDRESSRFAESLLALDDILALEPQDGKIVLARASTLFAWGRHHEARDAYLRAAALGVDDAALHAGLGMTEVALGRLGEAAAAMQRAMLAAPAEARWRHLMGTIQEAAGHPVEAISTFESVLAADPDRLESRIELCRSCATAGDPARCAMEARRILERFPQCAEAHALLGIAALMQDRPADALESLTRAEMIAGAGTDLELFDQIAIALNKLGRTRECIEMLEQRLVDRPNLNAHLGYAAALLSEGRFLDGWRQFEFRFFSGPLASMRPNYGKPVWGGQDLHGKTLLVRAEQGFGDVFQMLRYLPLLKALGARILLQPIVEIESMYAQLEGVDVVVEADRPLPPFDYWIHLMSLPRVFATTVATIPATVPYLRVNPELAVHWRSRIGDRDGLKVGIAWAGNPRHSDDANRSVPPTALRSLLMIPQAQFLGFHRQALPVDFDHETAGADFLNLGPELRDFGDTAAIIDQLDLLISVDTSVAHVGGALGKPVWLLLQEPAEYRWFRNREDTPWYPTVRLFRQRQPRDWVEVVERVAGALRQLAALKTSGATPEVLAAHARSAASPPAIEADVARTPPGIAVAAETRAGLMQFDPRRHPEGRSLDWYGEYLQPVLETLVGLVRPGETVLEAGTGYGAHAIMIGRVLGEAGHLIVYEDDPATRRMLGHNLAANGPISVTLMRGRLGRGPRYALRNDAEGHSAESSPLHMESVDDLRLERLDWLKTNPRADARAVLDGARDSLWRLRPCVLVCADGASGLPDMAAFCGDYGYRAWRIAAQYFRAGNFNCRTDDIFDASGVVAVLAIPEEVEAKVALEPLIR